jgi:lipopolysaccharide biosynthesis glycosyltransferase
MCPPWSMLWKFILFLFSLQDIVSLQNISSPINVVYVIDSYSYQYFILSVSSIAKYHQAETIIEVHVIIATASMSEYYNFEKRLENIFACYPSLKMNCYRYLVQNHYTSSMKQGGPHWLSTTEKLRNYIPEIIPHLSRYIYFDNDIITTKPDILYYLWKQNLKDAPLGLVGNVLHKPEFEIVNRFYDLTNPFIQQSFNLTPTLEHPTLTLEDLQTVLPIYPNNGVMLVNATRWNELQICSFAR